MQDLTLNLVHAGTHDVIPNQRSTFARTPHRQSMVAGTSRAIATESAITNERNFIGLTSCASSFVEVAWLR
jgi:hypothetical protein